MTLNFQTSFEDFTQARTAHATARRGKRWISSLFLLGLTAGVILLVVTHHPSGRSSLNQLNWAAGKPLPVPMQDRVIPAIPWLLLPIAFIRTMIAQFRRPKARYIDVAHNASWQDRLDRAIPAVLVTTGLFAFAWQAITATPEDPATVSAGALPWIIVAAFLGLLIHLRIPRHVWNGSASLKREKTVDADAERIVIADESITCIYRWAGVVRFVESSLLFLIYPTEHEYQIVPKRAFAGTDQMEEFRVLGAQWELNQTHAFPVTPIAVVEPLRIAG